MKKKIGLIVNPIAGLESKDFLAVKRQSGIKRNRRKRYHTKSIRTRR